MPMSHPHSHGHQRWILLQCLHEGFLASNPNIGIPRQVQCLEGRIVVAQHVTQCHGTGVTNVTIAVEHQVGERLVVAQGVSQRRGTVIANGIPFQAKIFQ